MLKHVSGLILLAAFATGASSCSIIDGESGGEIPPPEETALWLTQAEIDALPTEGESFENVVAWANSGLSADIADQNHQHEAQTYAAALLCARGVGEEYCDIAEQGLQDAIGTEGSTEEDVRSLPLARNLLSYALAANLIDYRDPAFLEWLDQVRFKELTGRTLISTHEDRPNNWGTHAGASRIAAAYVLGDTADIAAAARVFHGYLGNRDVYVDFKYGGLAWQADPRAPVGINPAGSTLEGQNVDGAQPEEMRRCGTGAFVWPPCRTGYTWEALQGSVAQAELLTRLGYPAWEWEDRALLRAVEFVYNTTFADGENDPAVGDDRWQIWLINYAYGTDYPAERATQPGKNVGFTDWTHGGRTALD